ncbi:hypothetical protein UlMin_010732 [Ulmus minor]
MLKCREKGLIVLPIFLDTDPSHVRKQRGPFNFRKHEKRFKNDKVRVQEWRQALTEAAGIAGWDSREKRQADIVEEVVRNIMKIKISINLKISIYPIGYDDCDEYLKLLLQMGSDDVFVVGIVGESKMGKTMIAKAVYDRISHAFDGSSFLKGIGQRSKEPNGLVQLQEKLLHDVLKGKDIKINSIIGGLEMIKENLCHKRVLIVLDDVNNLEPLSTLVGSRKWFGLGSKIIITTRSLPLLQIYGVDQIFMAQGLPVPLDIQEIWEQYRQTGRRIAGLKEYIQRFCYETNEKVRCLEDCLHRERQKNAIQAQKISELENCKGGEVGSK